MGLIHILGFIAVIFFFSLLLSYFWLNLARKKNIVDIPNDRSAHNTPIPRGGGLAIVLSIIIAALYSMYDSAMSATYIPLIGLGATAIATVGILDDIEDLSVTIRVALYLAITALFILAISRIIPPFNPGLFFFMAITIAISWLINLFNFMDGADALAGIQAVLISLPAGIILYSSNEWGAALFYFALAAGTAGFLILNWPPAKIFMGDVGSCTLGFTIGGLMLIGYLQHVLSIYIGLILLSVFITDATLTLLSRIINGEKWHQAHCCHAYQRYLQMGHTHRQLAIIFTCFGVIVLWPLTYLAYTIPGSRLPISGLVYSFLGFVWYAIQQRYNRSANV